MLKKKSFFIKEVNGSEVNVIRVAENPMFHIISRLMNFELKDNMSLDFIIKSKINKDLVKNGLMFEGKKFVFYISTSSQMKNSDAWFVREDVLRCFKNAEHVASTGKITEMYSNPTEININKDIISRISLLFTGSLKTAIKPNIIVVKDINFTGKYDIKAFDGDNLVNIDGKEMVQTAFDGAGIASEEIMKEISKELDLSFDGKWFGIRIPKFATKGLITSVNFMEYFNDNYIDDTDAFKKIEQDFYIKDFWGDFQKVDNRTLILPESCCKWAKWYKSSSEYSELSINGFEDVMDCIYISKPPKEKAKKYTYTSYQSLLATGITPKTVEEMSKKEEMFYRGICSGKKESILEFLNVISDVDYKEDKEEEVKKLSDRLSILLSTDFEKYIEIPWAKATLARLVDKKVRELATGRFLIKGNFKVCVPDPISFLDYIMQGVIIPNLKANELYVSGEVEDEVGVLRFPIAAYQELTKEKLVSNKLLDKYCNYTNEMIVVNQDDLTAVKKSGSDYDTDMFQVIYDKTFIKNIVPLEDNRPFVNLEDGKQGLKNIYSWDARVENNVKFSGNLIGKIAVLSSVIMDQCQDVNVYLDSNKNVVEYKTLREQYGEDWTKINSHRIDRVLNDEELREYFISNMRAKEKDICKLLELSQISIDAPKTGILPDQSILKEIKGDLQNPSFFQYLPKKDYNSASCGFVKSVMSEHCQRIINTLYNTNVLPLQRYGYMDTNTFDTLLSSAKTIKIDEVEVKEIFRIICSNFKNVMREFDSLNKLKYGFEDVSKKREALNMQEQVFAEDIYKKYDRANIIGAIIAFGLRNDYKGRQKYIFDFFFKSVVDMLVAVRGSVEQLVVDEDGEIDGLFNKYSLKRFTIDESFRDKFAKKESFEIKRKLDTKITIKVRLLGEITSKNATIKENKMFINNNVVGEIYAASVIKSGFSLEEIQGNRLLISVETSPSGKSATIIIN